MTCFCPRNCDAAVKFACLRLTMLKVHLNIVSENSAFKLLGKWWQPSAHSDEVLLKEQIYWTFSAVLKGNWGHASSGGEYAYKEEVGLEPITNVLRTWASCKLFLLHPWSSLKSWSPLRFWGTHLLFLPVAFEDSIRKHEMLLLVILKSEKWFVVLERSKRFCKQQTPDLQRTQDFFSAYYENSDAAEMKNQ